MPVVSEELGFDDEFTPADMILGGLASGGTLFGIRMGEWGYVLSGVSLACLGAIGYSAIYKPLLRRYRVADEPGWGKFLKDSLLESGAAKRLRNYVSSA